MEGFQHDNMRWGCYRGLRLLVRGLGGVIPYFAAGMVERAAAVQLQPERGVWKGPCASGLVEDRVLMEACPMTAGGGKVIGSFNWTMRGTVVLSF